MAAQGQQLLAGFCVPHLRRLVITGGGEALAIGAIGHTINRARVAAQGQQLLAGFCVPHLRRLVITGGGEALAIGAIGHTHNRVRVAAQGHTYLGRQDCLVQRLFRGGHRRLPKLKRGVHRLHAQKNALFRIVTETLGGKRGQFSALTIGISLSSGPRCNRPDGIVLGGFLLFLRFLRANKRFDSRSIGFLSSPFAELQSPPFVSASVAGSRARSQ